MKTLAEIEKEINGYINEIEKIEEFGDKKLIFSIEQERKKDNKREKQLELKLNHMVYTPLQLLLLGIMPVKFNHVVENINSHFYCSMTFHFMNLLQFVYLLFC